MDTAYEMKFIFVGPTILKTCTASFPRDFYLNTQKGLKKYHSYKLHSMKEFEIQLTVMAVTVIDNLKDMVF